jgi:hypothetical protein
MRMQGSHRPPNTHGRGITSYVATDQSGLASSTTRTVIIQPANDNTPPLSATGTTATSTSL